MADCLPDISGVIPGIPIMPIPIMPISIPGGIPGGIPGIPIPSSGLEGAGPLAA